MDKLLLKQAIYYGSYLVFPFVAYVAFRLWRNARNRWTGIALLIGALLFAWARFVELQIILRIALIADLRVFGTTGVGETGLPLRLMVPPVVHVIVLH